MSNIGMLHGKPFLKKAKTFLVKQRLRLLGFVFFTFLLSLLPADNLYFHLVSPQTHGIPTTNAIDLPPAPQVPLNIQNVPAPVLSAAGIIIKDIPSGIIIYQQNQDMLLPPASTTKLMTALVSLDHYRLEDVLTVKTIISDEKKMGLVPGEKITAESLLYGALVLSANDAAYTLAENYPGGVTAFAAAMNEKAAKLYLTHTYFINPVGFDADGQYTTAGDLAKLAIAALSDKRIAKIVATREITVSDVSYTYYHDLRNVNELVGKIPGVAGVKTGYTQSAGEVLVSEVKKDGKDVLFVVLKSLDRFGESTKLINWVFANFTWVSLSDIIPNIPEK